jgi:hypothetical protein
LFSWRQKYKIIIDFLLIKNYLHTKRNVKIAICFIVRIKYSIISGLCYLSMHVKSHMSFNVPFCRKWNVTIIEVWEPYGWLIILNSFLFNLFQFNRIEKTLLLLYTVSHYLHIEQTITLARTRKITTRIFLVIDQLNI